MIVIFFASLSAVAKTHPEKIRDAIKDNHDGTYTVSFPGAKGEKFTVDAATQSEMGLYNGGTKDGTWASIMESAFGKYRAKELSKGEPLPPQEGANTLGQAAPVIKLLTGREANVIDLDEKSKQEVAHILKSALAAGKAITTGTDPDEDWREFFGLGSERTPGNLLRKHEFTVLGFTPDSHGGKVLIRNHWGRGKGTTDGTISMSLEKYLKNFDDLTVQQ